MAGLAEYRDSSDSGLLPKRIRLEGGSVDTNAVGEDQLRTWTTVINVNNLQAVAWMQGDAYRLALYAAWTIVDTLTMMVNSYALFLIIALLVGRQGVPAFAMDGAGAFGISVHFENLAKQGSVAQTLLTNAGPLPMQWTAPPHTQKINNGYHRLRVRPLGSDN
jgi:hypothetical protein